MKQELGWTAAIAVALAATIGVSSHFDARPMIENSSPAKPPGQSTTKPKTPTDPFEQGPCVDIEEHLQAFLVDGRKDSIAAPPRCFGKSELTEKERTNGETVRKSAQNLRFVSLPQQPKAAISNGKRGIQFLVEDEGCSAGSIS